MNLAMLRNLKPKKNWVILAFSVGIGLAAAIGAKRYLSNQMIAIETRARGKTVAIVVAKRDLAKGTRLSADTLAVRPVPQNFSHSLAVLPEQFDRVEGQTLAYPVKSGEMILWSLLEGKKSPSFSARVAVGRRAMTVPVDEINSISGMLEPGDTVDLMATIERKNKKITFPLLQSVRVMATGQRSADDPKSGERRQYSTVTLDTSPSQAQRVIVAREAGRITALLRNPKDKRAMPNAADDVAALLGIKGGDGQFAEGDEWQIPVLYGGRGSIFPSEALRLGQTLHADGPIQQGDLKISIPPTAATMR